MKNCDGHVKGGNRGLYSPSVTLSLPLVFSIHHENLRPSNGPSRLRRRSNATKPKESTCASLFFHGEVCVLLCLLLSCAKCGVRLPSPVGHDKLQMGFPWSDMLSSFTLAIPPQGGLPYCYSGDALPSHDMTNANVQRGECPFSEHHSALPTHGEVCSLFSFVHNEFASASLPHHTYHIHNSVPSVFDSSPFEVTVGSAYHEARGTHTHKHGTRSLFVAKVYALHTVYMHFSGRRPLPCHNISRDMDRTEDPSHLSPTKGTNASLIAGEVCSPQNPIQRSSARAQDTNLLTSLGVDSWTSVFVHSSVIHPSPYHPVPSDEEQGGMPSHTHTENDQNTSLAAREVCFSPDHTGQRRGRHVTFWFYSLYCLPVSLHCESPIAQECQGVSAACCSLTLVHRDKPHTGQPPFDGTNTSHASRIWSIINLLGGGVRLSNSAFRHVFMVLQTLLVAHTHGQPPQVAESKAYQERGHCKCTIRQTASPSDGEVCYMFADFDVTPFPAACSHKLPHERRCRHRDITFLSPIIMNCPSQNHAHGSTGTFSFHGPHSSVLPSSAKPDLRELSWPACHIYAAGWIHRYPVSCARRLSTGMRQGDDGPQGRSEPIRI